MRLAGWEGQGGDDRFIRFCEVMVGGNVVWLGIPPGPQASPHSSTATALGHRIRHAVELPGCYQRSLRRLSETRLPSRAHESRKTR